MKTALVLSALLSCATLDPLLPQAAAASSCSFSCCDAPAHWAPRHGAGESHFAITTQDGDVTLLLTRDLMALQLSDRTFHRVERELRREARREDEGPLAEAIQVAVVSGVRALMDHSAECSLDDLRDVDYRGGELIFTAANGRRVLKDVEISDTDLARGFSANDARAFVREFRRMKARSN